MINTRRLTKLRRMMKRLRRGRGSIRIAVIGWGSLLWRPGELALATGRWNKDGPTLPIEFARRSRKATRLTLAVTPNSDERVRTYWAVSDEHAIPDARENLRLREGAPHIEDIFALDKQGRYWGRERDPGPREDVLLWLSDHPALDAVIWTGLKANWPKGKALTFATVDAYVSGQSLIDRAGIKNYVRRTPAQVDTSLRRNIEEAYGSRRIPVPASCFEDGIEEF